MSTDETREQIMERLGITEEQVTEYLSHFPGARSTPMPGPAPVRPDPCEHGFYSNEDAHACWAKPSAALCQVPGCGQPFAQHTPYAKSHAFDAPRAPDARPSAWACEVANKFYVETYDSLNGAQTVHALAVLLDGLRPESSGPSSSKETP